MSRAITQEKLLRELEDVAGRLFDEVRRDTGSFGTGSCIVNGKRVLLINSRQPFDERVAAIAREIAGQDSDRVFLKPAVRSEIERWSTGA